MTTWQVLTEMYKIFKKFKNSPYIFIIVYISSIFIFAFIYSFMPYSFYHTTVKYENSIQEGIKEIEPDLLREIKDNLRTDPNSDSVNMNSASFSLNNVYINDLNIKGYTAYFSMGFQNITGKYNSQIILSQYHIDFYEYDSIPNDLHEMPHTVLIYEDSPFPFWYGGRIGLLFKKNNCIIRPDSIIENDSNFASKPQIDRGFLLISDSFLAKLSAYSKAQIGFPGYTKGNFSRMFYLSASTITTVGFGDIVPITPSARILLSIEAIWGIIIIGLFLNSLANRIKL